MLVRMHGLTCTRVLCMHYNGLLDVCMYAYADVHRGCLDLYIDIWQFKNVWIMTLLYGSHNGVVNTLRKLIRISRVWFPFINITLLRAGTDAPVFTSSQRITRH